MDLELFFALFQKEVYGGTGRLDWVWYCTILWE